MKILYLDQSAELGGAELCLFDEVTHLPHQATVLLFEDGPLRERFALAGVKVAVVAPAARIAVRRESGLLAAVSALPAAAGLVRTVARHARGHDLIYANSQKAFVIGAFAAALSGRKLVWRLNDVLSAAHFSATLRRLAVFLANWKASRVIVNSTATGEAFASVGGDRTRLAVAYPGIAEAPFRAVPSETIARLHAELGGARRKLIGVFGRLAAWKGQGVFIDALAQLPNAIGVIVGGPLFGEDAYEATLRRQVEAAGLADRIRFLGFRSDIPALMQAMDIIVHSSIAPEPFGRVVVEAMLAGRPVVASAAGGVLEILEHGKTGILYEPGNAEALAEALRALIADPHHAATIAATGHARARSIFTVPATAARIVQAIEATAVKRYTR